MTSSQHPTAHRAVQSSSPARSASAEHPKPKRKGTRSVASLTTAQLERKRANDREAQRAIRERTKAQIAKLERQVAEYRRAESRDETIRGLREKNHQLEEEIRQLRAELEQLRLGQPILPPYARQPYDTAMSRSSSTDSRGGDYKPALTNEYAATHYVTAPEHACETTWPPSGVACPLSTPATATPAASSPASTTNEDYRFMTPNSLAHHGYDGLRGPPPTSMPASMHVPLMGVGAGVAPVKMQDPADAGEWEYMIDGRGIQDIQLNADEVHGYARSQTGAISTHQYSGLQQHPWIYPTPFQPQSPGL